MDRNDRACSDVSVEGTGDHNQRVSHGTHPMTAPIGAMGMPTARKRARPAPMRAAVPSELLELNTGIEG